MNTVREDIKEIAEHEGEYIQLGGRGILDGLKIKPYKRRVYKILGVDVSGTLHCKAYRARGGVILPVCNQDQEYRIITANEFKALPEW